MILRTPNTMRMASPHSLPLTLDLIVTLASLSCACVAAGFYVHPLLLPMLTSSVLRLGSAILHTHLTTPILFLLLNVLVVALFVSSSMMPQGQRKQGHGIIIISNGTTGIIDDGADDGCGFSDDCHGSNDVSSTDEVFAGHGPLNDVPGDEPDFNVSNCHRLLHDDPADSFTANSAATDMQKPHSQLEKQPHTANSAAKDMRKPHSQVEKQAHTADLAAEDMRKSHGQPETQPHKTVKRRTNLLRSKSDGIILQGAVGQQRTPSELRPVRLLKKSGTFESAWRHRRVKPVVIVADPPEEGQVAEEEVDKKAEEFIGRFYQKMKLQR